MIRVGQNNSNCADNTASVFFPLPKLQPPSCFNDLAVNGFWAGFQQAPVM